MHWGKWCLSFLGSLLAFMWSDEWEHPEMQNSLLSSLIMCSSNASFAISLPSQVCYLWQCPCACLYFHPIFSSLPSSGSLDVSFPRVSKAHSLVLGGQCLFCTDTVSACSTLLFPLLGSCCIFLLSLLFWWYWVVRWSLSILFSSMASDGSREPQEVLLLAW